MARYTYHELFQCSLEHLIIDTGAFGVFGWRKRVFHDVFNVDANIDLVQHNPHRSSFGVCEHDKFDVGGSLIVM